MELNTVQEQSHIKTQEQTETQTQEQTQEQEQSNTQTQEQEQNISIIDTKEQSEKIEVKPENLLIDTIEYLYKFMVTIRTDKITPTNFIIITTQLIQLVEKYKNLTGYQKKMVVISVIKKLVNSQFNTEDDKKAINLIINFTLPSIIDNLINAINGNLKFDKENSITFFKKYFCCYMY